MTQDENYYSDKTAISHSMLCDFVSYDKFGNRFVNPFNYYAKHVSGKAPKFEQTDAMTVGKIVDAYFCDKAEYELYAVVSRRSKDSTEYDVTQTMMDDAMLMIEAFKGLYPFMNAIEAEGSSTQSILRRGHFGLSLKGKLDLYNKNHKLIIDQKTTASIDTLWQDLQFKGGANIYARYIRQGAFYRYLSNDSETTFALAIGDKSGNVAYVPVRNDILDRAWEVISKDLEELKSYYDSDWNKLDDFDPFLKTIEDTEDDDAIA